jgi:hypothetical protein
MSSGGGSSSGETFSSTALCDDSPQEEVIHSEVCALQRVMACWLVLEAGKGHLFTNGVDKAKTRLFRGKPYGDTMDCAPVRIMLSLNY